MSEDEELEAYLKNAPETAIGIYIPDPTYTEVNENDDWDRRREEFRQKLEAEYGVTFRESNIGRGADVPAFVTWLEVLSPLEKLGLATLAAFFLGKKIKENLEAWHAIYEKYLKAFFKYNPVFDRKGASLLAFNRLVEESGSVPSSYRLIGYGTVSVVEEDYMNRIDDITEIAAEPEPMFLGFVVHVFEVDVDEKTTYRIIVDFKNVRVIEKK